MSAILQTRPQGEKSAEQNLERRGIRAIRPREIVVTRKRQANGKRVDVEREVSLLPGYVIAAPQDAHQLDVALGDMAEREPRKDVQRVVGWAGPAALEHVMGRHMQRIEPPESVRIVPGMTCEMLKVGFEGKTVLIVSVHKHTARCNYQGICLRVDLDHLRPVALTGKST